MFMLAIYVKTQFLFIYTFFKNKFLKNLHINWNLKLKNKIKILYL